MPLLGDPCQYCVNNLARAPKEAYLITDTWWRARVSSGMYDGIDNLKSLYKRAARSFSDGTSSASDAPCRSARQSLTHQPSVASEAQNISRGV